LLLFRKTKEDSSFFEKKEAKKLLSFRGAHSLRAACPQLTKWTDSALSPLSAIALGRCGIAPVHQPRRAHRRKAPAKNLP
jgi:hypothetical protein